MAHYLQFDGVNDVVNLASTVTPSGTTLESSFYIEFEIAFRNTSSGAINSIFGPDRSLFRRSDGLLLTQGAGGSGEIRVNYIGVLVDEFHVFKLEKTGGTNDYSVSMNGGALTTKVMPNKLRLGKIGHSSDGYSKIYLKRMTLIDHLDSTNSVNLDPNASDTSDTGLQPVLVDTLNGNNATGIGFPTDGSAWVYYDDGGTPNTANIAFNGLQPVFAVAMSKTVPVNTADITFTGLQPVFAASLTNGIAPNTANIAFTGLQPVFAVAMSKTVPVNTADIAFTGLQPVFAASLTNGIAPNTANIAFNGLQPVFAVAMSKTVPVNTADIAFTGLQPVFQVRLVNGAINIRVTPGTNFQIPYQSSNMFVNKENNDFNI